ncbi:MAG TPA: helicase, partial [Saprospirales bacterium]|nr:helicase [Saprospirales bacterium]
VYHSKNAPNENHMSSITNPELELAFDYVLHTHKNIFLTGKAGTGKTTFLRRIKEVSPKRMVIVAPTGVAAINAGGMTIHSFFQLPFSPFLPGAPKDPSRQRNFNKEKVRLIQSLDLLVIDEISMVRADLLDAVDEVLRRYRDRRKPFGGLQLLMIGDLHQLPPVVKDEEWNLLREHYDTAYFFGSHALQDTEPVSIELKHIYRQSDETFIHLLNKVRNNQLDDEVLRLLNSRFVPNFQPPPGESYITLTAHNHLAQSTNIEHLAAIREPMQSFKAEIKGEFPPSAYPAEECLDCKLGAQVMFVKNDLSREKRYYNGKIGIITGFDKEHILVRCPGDAETITVGRVEWQNLKYSLNEQSKEVKEDVLGTFSQFPLKLAWAITIHKSQGLTFERAIIDAQAAFAHGQVYVALSRCKSFEGIVLRSKIVLSSVKTDQVVQRYTEEADKNTPDRQHLSRSKEEFQQSMLRELFDFSGIQRQLIYLDKLYREHAGALLPEAQKPVEELYEQFDTKIHLPAERFKVQLVQYFRQDQLPEENELLQERLRKAGIYFVEQLQNGMLKSSKNLSLMTDNQSVKNLLQEQLEVLQKELFVKNAGFATIQEGFSSARYLRSKTDAELDFSRSRSTFAPSKSMYALQNIPNASLFVQLKTWRDQQAEEQQVEPYEILSNRSMLELVQTLPGNRQALAKVVGIGRVKLERFGEVLLAMVRVYKGQNKGH